MQHKVGLRYESHEPAVPVSLLRVEGWCYMRRAPTILADKIGRCIISRNLQNDSVCMAHERKEMCAYADDACLQKLMPSTFERLSADRTLGQASVDAKAIGFT